MIQTVRLFLVLEGVSFVIAALVHTGIFVDGYWDPAAAIAESVIGAVLLVGLALTWVYSATTRRIGLAAQGLALLGTLIGTYLTAIVGLGTTPEVVYHLTILAVLATGLVVAARAPVGATARG